MQTSRRPSAEGSLTSQTVLGHKAILLCGIGLSGNGEKDLDGYAHNVDREIEQDDCDHDVANDGPDHDHNKRHGADRRRKARTAII